MNLELLLAFALMTGLTSVVPGPSMLFVMTESIWRGPRAGWVALLGMQVGYLFWWALAAFGLGSLARLYPLAFDILALGGIAYIGWLGVQALLHAGEGAGKSESEARKPSRHAFRDGMAVAIGNPKALVYVVALLPPFVDATRPILPQLAVLTVVGTVIDLAVGGVYIVAGNRLAQMLTRPETRTRIDRGVGAVFILIALGIGAELLLV